ncbi:unnamed protein product [Kuraishia capsulata CBS 1993]|uniref:DMAP1-binding domain-containing protein n=1 Tax=Kuraishia capsulata CBS 1993 TaxID=1382522 RepID=W6MRS5_9ASCO|nr:uncharacterized protein KUCA_T00005050001 [Kuraishia capsulata CBS 1993]CDK29063.1 unnamed protein product [Kuraishia capsulata CBS 1993]
MDFTIPQGADRHLEEQVIQLIKDYQDGYLTEKGYVSKRSSLLTLAHSAPYNLAPVVSSRSLAVVGSAQSDDFGMASPSRTDTNLADYPTSMVSAPNYQDFGALNGTPHLSHTSDNYLSKTSSQQGRLQELQRPLEARQLQDLNPNDSFGNLPSILRHRGVTYAREVAIALVDARGKEIQSITWEKLYLKSEKIAQQIRDKSGLYRGDRVCLVYQNHEVSEFVVALFGCFLAGVVAVPMSSGLPVKDLIKIMNDTQAHLCLMSESVQKHFDKYSSNTNSKIVWPKGVEMWKTTDMGTYQPAKNADPPALQVPDLAYIEYSKSPTGDLRGVVLSHKTLMHQMGMFTSILGSMPGYTGKSIKRSDISYTKARNILLSTLDTRQSIGLIVGVLFTIFSGNLLIWTPQQTMEVPGLYAHIITRYKVSMLLSDYLGMKQVIYNYQSFPQLTRTYSKKIKVDLSCVRWCLINAVTVDCTFHEMLTERWFKPLGCLNSKSIVCPMLTLSEFGGMVISMRDWLGGEDKLGCVFNKSLTEERDDDEQPKSDDSYLSEVLIDRASLTTNTVKVVSDKPPPSGDNEDGSKYVRCGAFGYPLPDATLAIVNPDTNILSPAMEVGEIWVDTDCLSGGFWGLKKDTEIVFHARCYDHAEEIDRDFLRTGLLGFIYNGKVYVLGPYEDRLRQKLILDSQSPKETLFAEQYHFHYASHLVKTLARNIPEVTDAAFFDIVLNHECVPIAVIESTAGKPSPLAGNSQSLQLDRAALDRIAAKAIDAIEGVHNVRLYCVMVTAPDVLPRTIRSGRLEIANTLCKKKFTEGTLSSVFVKFNMLKSLSQIQQGDDIKGGIWSPYASNLRSSSLSYAEKQYSGLDHRDTCIDSRTSIPLTDFKSLPDILKWRAKQQSDELAFARLDKINSREQKPLSWKKLEQRIFTVASYLMEKRLARTGDYVILMYSLSEEYVVAFYACLFLNIIPIPMGALDIQRLDEDVVSFVGVLKDYDVRMILCNDEVENTFKVKQVSNEMKKRATQSRITIPKTKNTTKLKKNAQSASVMYPKMAKFKEFSRRKTNVAMIWLQWTADYYQVGVELTNETIMGMCKVLKETCQMSSTIPLIGCVRHTSGLGMLQSTMMGIFLGCSTFLIAPYDYFTSPGSFYLALSRYKVKDTFVTDKMLQHAFKSFKPKNFDLPDLKNLMVGWDGRPDAELMKNLKPHFARTNLSSFAMSNLYYHEFNPMVTTRSYLAFDPIDLWLDPMSLSQGYVSLVNPKDNPLAIHIQDSGMVPVCTQIAIVNPQTCHFCKIGEFGEIWICSEATVSGFTNGPKGPTDKFVAAQFQGKIKDGNPELTYLRTGDLGFLHNIQGSVANDGTVMELQPLFVLGRIADTIEVMGLHYFALDIERAIEKMVHDIHKERVCLFRAGDYTVLIAEPRRTSSLASLVPLIVNTVLGKYGLIIDIVGFTAPGKFPLSRLATKQRARIVDSWLKGNLKMAAEFGVNYGESSLVKLVDRMKQKM